MSYTDEEQIEALRAWWRENGRAIIAGVVIAIVALIGWQQWDAYKQRRAELASQDYQAFRSRLLADPPAADAVALGEALLEQIGRASCRERAEVWVMGVDVKRALSAA